MIDAVTRPLGSDQRTAVPTVMVGRTAAGLRNTQALVVIREGDWRIVDHFVHVLVVAIGRKLSSLPGQHVSRAAPFVYVDGIA